MSRICAATVSAFDPVFNLLGNFAFSALKSIKSMGIDAALPPVPLSRYISHINGLHLYF